MWFKVREHNRVFKMSSVDKVQRGSSTQVHSLRAVIAEAWSLLCFKVDLRTTWAIYLADLTKLVGICKFKSLDR